MAIFTVNTGREDPYKNYRFLVYFVPSTTPVAAVSKISALRRSTEVIEYKEGGSAIILKGIGRTKYDPITLKKASRCTASSSTAAGYPNFRRCRIWMAAVTPSHWTGSSWKMKAGKSIPPSSKSRKPEMPGA